MRAPRELSLRQRRGRPREFGPTWPASPPAGLPVHFLLQSSRLGFESHEESLAVPATSVCVRLRGRRLQAALRSLPVPRESSHGLLCFDARAESVHT